MRQALKPTQPPLQWARKALSLQVKSPGHEAENSLTSITKVKNEWTYTSNPPIGLHGMHTFTFTEYSGHVLPVILLHKVININFTSNNIMGYWELQICFTWPTTFLFTFIYELDVIRCSSVLYNCSADGKIFSTICFFIVNHIFLCYLQMTSTPLCAHRRLQLSIALHKIDIIDLMQEAPTIILPILWIDEVGIFLILQPNVEK